MNSDQTYNGWTNYETWLVKLWQDNEQCEQEYWQEQAAECVKVDGKEHGVTSLADTMKEYYQDLAGQLINVTGFWADLLNASLCTVNWREIAEHWIDEVETEEATTQKEGAK